MWGIQYLRILAVAYEKTEDLARQLRAVGCGDLDVEGNWFKICCVSEHVISCHLFNFFSREVVGVAKIFLKKFVTQDFILLLFVTQDAMRSFKFLKDKLYKNTLHLSGVSFVAIYSSTP